MLALLTALVLSACASSASQDSAHSEQEAGNELHDDLIRTMLTQKKYYAALAHVQQQEAISGDTPQLRYLEGEARRNLGQDAVAEELYKSLLKTPYAAEGRHGLGLLYAKVDLRAAVWQLQQAVQRRPTDAEMRNDLGYALMVAGRFNEAMPQLATAAELDPDDTRSRNNLVILLLLTHDEAGVKRIAGESGMSADTLSGLRKQAAAFKVRKS
ncbi:MAG TPA: tetratricopeptide repeat protein [Nevskiaceae bacterium]|nr:tetratricopeptide repeat protein [Nevskiaceae bacterium]